MKILVVNGPNINMLGIREPEIYGDRTYSDLVDHINSYCLLKNIDVEVFQSNHEGDLITKIQNAYGRVDGIVINPAAYTHTSIAILDALKAVSLPVVEVHLSHTDSREEFRKKSFISYIADEIITGKGFEGYIEAIEYLINKGGA